MFSSDYLEDEFKEPFESWRKTKDMKSADKLLAAIDPILQSSFRTYGGGSTVSPNIKTKAKIIALNSLEKYDPKKSKLKTYLMTHLQGLRRFSAKDNQIISLPERVALDLSRLNNIEKEFNDMYGREPSDQELADLSNFSLKRITHLRKAQPGIPAGSLVTEGDSGLSQFDPPVINFKDNDDVWVNFVRNDLQPLDQLILEYSLGLNGKPVLNKGQISKKLKLYPSLITQRAKVIQDKLSKKKDLGLGLF